MLHGLEEPGHKKVTNNEHRKSNHVDPQHVQRRMGCHEVSEACENCQTAARWGREISMSALKSLRQTYADVRGPGMEIGCGFLGVYAQREGEAFVGYRLGI